MREFLLREIFKRFSASNIDYCVLRNYRNIYTDSLSDIDILIKGSDIPLARKIIDKIICDLRVVVILKKQNNYLLKYGIATDESTVRLDFQSDFRYCGLLYNDGIQVLKNKVLHEGGFYIPAPPYEAVYILLQALFAKDKIKKKYQDVIGERLSSDKEAMRTILTDLFGDKLTGELIESIKSKQWEKVFYYRHSCLNALGISPLKRFYLIFRTKMSGRLRFYWHFLFPKRVQIISFEPAWRDALYKHLCNHMVYIGKYDIKASVSGFKRLLGTFAMLYLSRCKVARGHSVFITIDHNGNLLNQRHYLFYLLYFILCRRNSIFILPEGLVEKWKIDLDSMKMPPILVSCGNDEPDTEGMKRFCWDILKEIPKIDASPMIT